MRHQQIRRGLAWNALALIGDKGGGFLVRLALARLLVPESFGLIVMVVAILGLFFLLSDFGLKSALVQRPRDAITTLQYDSAFWLLSGFSVVWMLVFGMIAGPTMVWFYDEPQLSEIALAMAICLPIQSATIVSEVRLLRRMRFKLVVLAELWATLAASIVALILAWQNFGVWALVALQIVRSFTRSAMIWRFGRWRPRKRYSFDALNGLFGLSGYMLGNQIVSYLRSQIDKIVIGFFLGTASLGVYTLAYMLTETLRVQISTVIGRVMYPAYSRMQQDKEEIRRLYLRVAKYVSLAVLPVTVLIFYLASSIVRVGFGEEWRAAVQPLRILCLASAVIAMSGSAADVLRGIGKPDVSFRIQTSTTLLVALPGISLGAYFYGLPGAAYGVVVLAITSRILFLIALRREISLSIFPYLVALRSSFAISFLLIVAFELSRLIWQPNLLT